MFWPLSLIVVAVAAGSAVAFGTHPRWAELENGLQVILWARRLQWPLVGLTAVASLGLAGMVIAGRRRAFWLVGLAPVLALFAHRFAGGRAEDLGVVDEPTFADAAKADFVGDSDWVVSARLGDVAYAYPFAALFPDPVVVQADHDDRMVLVWNAYANRAVAFRATGDLRGRDLEVVSTPANAVLVYNARHGQFVVGVTGLTPAREKPIGFGNPVPTSKSTFAAWRTANPAGKVMRPTGRLAWRGPTPTAPVGPAYAAFGMPAGTVPAVPPMAATSTSLAAGPATRPAAAAARSRRVTLVGSTRPVAVDPASLSARPAVLTVDDRPAVLLRSDGPVNSSSIAGRTGPNIQPTAGVRAYVRKVDDMVLRLEPAAAAKLPAARMRDVETDCLWSAAGVAIGGNATFRGRRLAGLPVDDDVDYDVMKWWMPELETFAEPPLPPVAAVATKSQPGGSSATRPARKPKKSKAATAAAR
ncbi:MAG: hypothetical protein JWO31_2701 [Phycisphaerales bacterium]|nr:hypothetical protein [Phycisphaerales bacterium]